jgi:hypothetical protein
VGQQLGYNLLISFVGAITTIIATSFNDRTPRRWILVGGTSYMAAMRR